jgi:hypothetical protein
MATTLDNLAEESVKPEVNKLKFNSIFNIPHSARRFQGVTLVENYLFLSTLSSHINISPLRKIALIK